MFIRIVWFFALCIYLLTRKYKIIFSF